MGYDANGKLCGDMMGMGLAYMMFICYIFYIILHDMHVQHVLYIPVLLYLYYMLSCNGYLAVPTNVAKITFFRWESTNKNVVWLTKEIKGKHIISTSLGFSKSNNWGWMMQ